MVIIHQAWLETLLLLLIGSVYWIAREFRSQTYLLQMFVYTVHQNASETWKRMTHFSSPSSTATSLTSYQNYSGVQWSCQIQRRESIVYSSFFKMSTISSYCRKFLDSWPHFARNYFHLKRYLQIPSEPIIMIVYRLEQTRSLPLMSYKICKCCLVCIHHT